MMEKFFKVTLITDVVLNSKLATEGNMETLDYIPGSNFLGIVASQLYSKVTDQEAYDLFHSGKVSFGDATISEDGELSYPVPFDYMMVKGEDKLGKDKRLFLQHLLTEENHPKEKINGKENKLQLKQKRGGFITPSGKAITKIEKIFALKSAQDAEKRRSKDGAMFGFESLKAGQEFIFSVHSDDENLLRRVEGVLKGKKRIGKSKTAQYGIVDIEPINHPQKVATFSENDYSLVYVQSNLCIIDAETGQPTLQPKANDLGLNGEIDWTKSLIRLYAYSPWNGKRNTNDTLRTCIGAGSVLYVKGENDAGEKSIGAFQAEGLGRIIVNPAFLKGNEKAECDFIKIEKEQENKEQKKFDFNQVEVSTSLGKFLRNRGILQQEELALSERIQEQYLNATNKEGTGRYQKVTSSQWGAIRAYATKAKNFDELKESLLFGSDAYLKHGVAYDRIWSKGQNMRNLENVFEIAECSSNPTIFIAKFATQMAKYEQKKEKKSKAE